MLNEEKIKEQYALALMDQKEGKSLENQRLYYRGDYISKEILKSFFSGTLAFLGIGLIVLLKDMDGLMDTINTINYQTFAVELIALYLGFMAIYFIITFVIYLLRFETQKKKLKKYRTHLKRLTRLYNSEEK